MIEALNNFAMTTWPYIIPVLILIALIIYMVLMIKSNTDPFTMDSLLFLIAVLCITVGAILIYPIFIITAPLTLSILMVLASIKIIQKGLDNRRKKKSNNVKESGKVILKRNGEK